MERFRLKTATMAVHHLSDSTKGTAVVIPAGSELVSEDPIHTRAGFDHSQFVTMKWSGRMVQIFLLDLIDRGERVYNAER